MLGGLARGRDRAMFLKRSLSSTEILASFSILTSPPINVTSLPLLPSFTRQLKTVLFAQSHGTLDIYTGKTAQSDIRSVSVLMRPTTTAGLWPS